MDVLYSVRCADAGWDLRMSLRSLERNGANLGRVVLAGGPFPEWIQGADLVPCGSPYRRKQKNILHAIVEAMSRGAVSGPCLYSSDDHFTMRPCDLDAFPWFGRFADGGTMPGYAEYAATGRAMKPYRHSIAETRRLLESRGLPADWVSGHVNTHLDARDLQAVEELAAGWRDTEYGYEPSTLFIACARRRDPSIRIVPRTDVKVRGPYTAAALDALEAAGDGFLSCGESALCGEFRKWMEARFPEPSRFERS